MHHHQSIPLNRVYFLVIHLYVVYDPSSPHTIAGDVSIVRHLNLQLNYINCAARNPSYVLPAGIRNLPTFIFTEYHPYHKLPCPKDMFLIRRKDKFAEFLPTKFTDEKDTLSCKTQREVGCNSHHLILIVAQPS